MLKNLIVSNLILIESAKIPFEAGLNVLSGETGSGKSAILHALGLITGERADATIVRHGAEKGSVEAIFEIDHIPQVQNLLDESGIDHLKGEELIIRREISTQSNKSRAFINNQQVQLGLLKQVSALLMEIVGQHINQRLLAVESHRGMVDLYGSLEREVQVVSQGWNDELSLKERLEGLLKSESQRVREIEICQMELAELQQAKLKEDEEEELFSEYTLLSNAEELTTKVSEVSNALSGERQVAVLPLLNRHKHTLEHLQKIDPSFGDMASSFENALLELHEISQSLRQYQARIEHNPARLEEVNERLTLINRLKKKYGNTVSEIKSYQSKTEEKLNRLLQADSEIETLQNQLKNISEENNRLCNKLTEQRREAGQKLEKAMTKELRSLNMPKATFHCEMIKQERGRYGCDRIEFYFSPNVGEKQISVRDCASGGELSRIMLALQTLLAGKERIPSLIFDEIDANIGGETAVVVGEKLKQIGRKHQVLCITHFPQVAKQADHHLQISKQEKSGRTVTLVHALDETSREKELTRMLGG